MNPTLELLGGLRVRVPRGAYVRWGLALAAVKFAADTCIVYGFTHKTWSPLGYAIPSLVLRDLGPAPEAMNLALVALALPFLWVGVSMSVRRAADAGRSPWLGTGFLVPFVNYVTIVVLCVLPSDDTARWEPAEGGPYREPEPGAAGAEASESVVPLRVRSALLGVLASIALGMAMVALSVYGLGSYGTTLFFVTPFAMGATTAAVYNAHVTRSVMDTILLALVAAFLTGSALLLFAVEGALCLVMAFPIAAALATVGAVIGRANAISKRRSSRADALALLVLPLAALGEARFTTPPLHDVTTAIEIDAPPAAVWPNVIGFSDLPEPPAWQYRLGVAYPMRARIEGEGVGAVRRCEFSTGPFVEPITVWDPPNRLAFDVTQQPPSMTEWSPYEHVHAPHLEGYMTSRGGEFRLRALPGGRTRLEGTTHYTLAIYPAIYWRGFAELLLHGIHARVLEHIKRLSERGPRATSR